MAESPPDAPTTVDELLALHKFKAYQNAFDDAGLDDLQELPAVTYKDAARTASSSTSSRSSA